MEYRFFFFAGGEYNEREGNAFTDNFISYMTDMLIDRFSVIKGIYHSSPLVNVIWALNHAQKPDRHPEKSRTIASSVKQIISDPLKAHSQLTLVSSSYGSVVAAQVACCLAKRHLKENLLSQPFNIALGTSLLSKESDLYRELLHYQAKRIIGTIIYDELQDAGDNSQGIGGRNRLVAYANALGICFPFLTRKFKGPSFLNNHPVSGHLHRVRAQSVQKAKDFLRVILVDYELGGAEYREEAEQLLTTDR